MKLRAAISFLILTTFSLPSFAVSTTMPYPNSIPAVKDTDQKTSGPVGDAKVDLTEPTVWTPRVFEDLHDEPSVVYPSNIKAQEAHVSQAIKDSVDQINKRNIDIQKDKPKPTVPGEGPQVGTVYIGHEGPKPVSSHPVLSRDHARYEAAQTAREAKSTPVQVFINNLVGSSPGYVVGKEDYLLRVGNNFYFSRVGDTKISSHAVMGPKGQPLPGVIVGNSKTSFYIQKDESTLVRWDVQKNSMTPINLGGARWDVVTKSVVPVPFKGKIMGFAVWGDQFVVAVQDQGLKFYDESNMSLPITKSFGENKFQNNCISLSKNSNDQSELKVLTADAQYVMNMATGKTTGHGLSSFVYDLGTYGSSLGVLRNGEHSDARETSDLRHISEVSLGKYVGGEGDMAAFQTPNEENVIVAQLTPRFKDTDHKHKIYKEPGVRGFTAGWESVSFLTTNEVITYDLKSGARSAVAVPANASQIKRIGTHMGVFDINGVELSLAPLPKAEVKAVVLHEICDPIMAERRRMLESLPPLPPLSTYAPQ